MARKITLFIINLVTFLICWIGLGHFTAYATVTYFGATLTLPSVLAWGAANYIVANLISNIVEKLFDKDSLWGMAK